MIVLVVMCLLHLVFAASSPELPPSLRIVGGKNATKGQFPYLVSIRDSTRTSNFNHICGGVLIGYGEVLTAAHCVSNVPVNNLYVVAGTTSLSLAMPGYVSINASQIHVHEFYKQFSFGYDIAFIRLSKKLPENRNDIQPAFLLQDVPFDNKDCTVSGWGDIKGTPFAPNIPKDVQYAQVSYISNADCKKRYAYVQSDGICAAPSSNKVSGPCGDLDAGDPLYCGGGLLGLFSWSDSCGSPSLPGVYTAIPFHLYWISQRLNDVTTVTPTSKPTTKGTTKVTTKATTKGTTKVTTKPTTKGTTKVTTKATTKGTTKVTTKPTTKGTTKVTTKATTKGTTKVTTKPTTKGTTKPAMPTTTEKPPNSSAGIHFVNCFVVISALFVNLS